MSDLESILKKVRSLRDLAARAGTMAEAETAAAQADALIQKYRLEEADVEARGEQAEAIGEDETPLWTGSKFEPFRAKLAAVLSEHYGCVTFASRSFIRSSQVGVSLCIAGRASDVAIVRYMFAWLLAEITRLAGREYGASSKNAFRHGAVLGVSRALEIAKARTEADHARTAGHSAALAVSSRFEETKQWLATVHGKMGSARASATTGDTSAYLRGMRAGQSFNIGASLPEARRVLGEGDKS